MSARVVTDTKCGQLKPTSATLSRTMTDNTCLPGEPKVSFLVLPSRTTSEQCVKGDKASRLDSELRYTCDVSAPGQNSRCWLSLKLLGVFGEDDKGYRLSTDL